MSDSEMNNGNSVRAGHLLRDVADEYWITIDDATSPTATAISLVSHLAEYVREQHQLPDGPEDDINGSTTGLLTTLSRAFDQIRGAAV
jgi:hypothetical protein